MLPMSHVAALTKLAKKLSRQKLKKVRAEAPKKSNPLAVIQRKPLESDLSVARAGLMAAKGRKPVLSAFQKNYVHCAGILD